MAWSEKAIEAAADKLAQKMGYAGWGHGPQFRNWVIPILDAAAAVDGNPSELREQLTRMSLAVQRDCDVQWNEAIEAAKQIAIRNGNVVTTADICELKRGYDMAAHPPAPSLKTVVDYECGWNDAIEAAAKRAENLSFGIDIDEFREMTKKDHSVRACIECAASIRALKRG